MKFTVKAGDFFELELNVDPPKTIYEVLTNKVFCVFLVLMLIIVCSMAYSYKTGDFSLQKHLAEVIIKLLPKV